MSYILIILYFIGFVVTYFGFVIMFSDGCKNSSMKKIEINFGEVRRTYFDDAWLSVFFGSIWPLSLIIMGIVYLHEYIKNKVRLINLNLNLNLNLQKDSKTEDDS